MWQTLVLQNKNKDLGNNCSEPPTRPKDKKPISKTSGIKCRTCRLFFLLWVGNLTCKFPVGHPDQSFLISQSKSIWLWSWSTPHITFSIANHFSYLRRKPRHITDIQIYSNSYFSFHSHIDLNVELLILQANPSSPYRKLKTTIVSCASSLIDQLWFHYGITPSLSYKKVITTTINFASPLTDQLWFHYKI